VAYKEKGVKLKMNSQGPVGNSLNLKSKLNAPMNTIMAIPSAQAPIRKNLIVRKRAVSATIKDCLIVRRRGARPCEAAVAYFATTQCAGKLTPASAIRKFWIAHDRANNK